MDASKYNSVLSGKSFDASSRKRGTFVYKSLYFEGDLCKISGEFWTICMRQMFMVYTKLGHGRCLVVCICLVFIINFLNSTIS